MCWREWQLPKSKLLIKHLLTSCPEAGVKPHWAQTPEPTGGHLDEKEQQR